MMPLPEDVLCDKCLVVWEKAGPHGEVSPDQLCVGCNAKMDTFVTILVRLTHGRVGNWEVIAPIEPY
jgi:hypothetical protein